MKFIFMGTYVKANLVMGFPSKLGGNRMIAWGPLPWVTCTRPSPCDSGPLRRASPSHRAARSQARTLTALEQDGGLQVVEVTGKRVCCSEEG